MNRNLYDTDTITWSPQGRIFQIEYACEATKQGSCCIAVKNLNPKITKIDKHIGTTFSGTTSDAATINDLFCEYAYQHNYKFGSEIMVDELANKLSIKAQKNTMESGKRPYGVSMLLVGYDKAGPHIIITNPYGDYEEYYAYAFGNRCQSARTYLETNSDEFSDATIDDLYYHGIKAMLSTFSNTDSTINKKNIEIGIVGKNIEFKILSEEETQHLVDNISEQMQ